MFSNLVRAFTTKSTDAEAEQFLRALLAPDELLIWQKRPSERMLLEPRERNLMKGLYVNGALGAVIVAAIISSFFDVFPQVGTVANRLIPLVAIVVLFGGSICHRLFFHARRRNHFFYALTTNRVLVANLLTGRVVYDLNLKTMD